MRTQLVISLDGASRIKEGDDATIWVDARKIHLFDPSTGENLTMDADNAGIVPGAAEALAKAEEVGKEQDAVDPHAATT
jgi:multiple sugar transport system ATP-binding protein